MRTILGGGRLAHSFGKSFESASSREFAANTRPRIILSSCPRMIWDAKVWIQTSAVVRFNAPIVNFSCPHFARLVTLVKQKYFNARTRLRHQRHGKRVDIYILRQRDARHGFRFVEGERISVEISRARDAASVVEIVVVGHGEGLRFPGKVLRVLPVAHALGDGRGGAVAVMDD